jgi:hypothetical protein
MTTTENNDDEIIEVALIELTHNKDFGRYTIKVQMSGMERAAVAAEIQFPAGMPDTHEVAQKFALAFAEHLDAPDSEDSDEDDSIIFAVRPEEPETVTVKTEDGGHLLFETRHDGS